MSFHLGVLGLEEIAKASMAALRDLAQRTGRDDSYFESRWEDHPFKLFWALWLPTSKFTEKGFKEAEGLAGTLHGQRMASAYVNMKPSIDEEPLWSVPRHHAESLIGLAEGRLQLETPNDLSQLDPTVEGDLRWFLEANDDLEKRRMIFGAPSIQKRSELGSVQAWVRWLRQQFDDADAHAKSVMQQELQRQRPAEESLGKEKWRVNVRFYSTAQSVRPSAFKVWNDKVNWIQLSKAGDNLTIDAAFLYKEAVLFPNLYPVSYTVARQFLAALNIGSTGFWWWRKLEAADQFQRSVEDLGNPGIGVNLRIQGTAFQWHKQSLKEVEFNRVLTCFAAIIGPDDGNFPEITQPYLTALALLAKSDVHLTLAHHACEQFSAALKAALREFDGWSGDLKDLRAVLGVAFDGLLQPDDMDQLQGWLAEAVRAPGPENMERAAMLKVLCDGYLIGRFNDHLRRRAEADAKKRSEAEGMDT